MAAKRKIEESAEAPISTSSHQNTFQEQETLEQITVSSGREVYAPIPYHTFEIGPITLSSVIRENEAYEDAIERCSSILNDAIAKQFTEKLEGFFSRIGQLDEYMQERGMATRAAQSAFGENSLRPAQRSLSSGSYTPEKPSPAQLNLMSKRAQNAGVADLDIVTQNLFQKALVDITKKEASTLIDYLGTLPKAGPAVSTEAYD